MAMPDPERFRKWAELTGLGPLLAASVLVGWLGGTWLDSRFGTSPWLMTCGLLLGAIGGFIEVGRVLVKLGEGPGRRGARRRGSPGGAPDAEKDAAQRKQSGEQDANSQHGSGGR